MFSNKTALAACIALGMANLPCAAHADEKHLTLEDIDALARQNLVDSMSKHDGAVRAQGSGSTTPFPGAVAAPIQPAPTVVQPVVAKPKLDAAPVKQVPTVSFVGAYGDRGSQSVLYDYQGGIYPAQAGTKLLNGWTVAGVDGYTVTVSYGKRTWTEVISPPVTAIPVRDSTALQAITELGGPLPLGGLIPGATTSNAPGGRATFIPTVK